MIVLPPGFASQFRDRAGRVELRAVVTAPDARLVELARDLTPDERVRLYVQLRDLRVGFVESLAASAAGVDVERERRRLLRLLEIADAAELATA
ncbi:hypothetical protein [Urbifossiella limnaea]|uniref:Uncharacterized protein n=1 Tax=Urbifossiella limnaea TaxID=2528023 RepID=A0A517XUM3_9BACT|nr:hypothetical protein [Urbifossiella limnaea]QDU21207.1 hypothetical protein ETAA1_31720 [Urbifossiella limnaea]